MLFRVNLANSNDFNPLMKFYKDAHSLALPAPSVRALGQAIEKRELMKVEGAGGIAATAGIFDITPGNCRDLVSELAGTRVTRPLGGAAPISVQGVLIVLRTLLFALAHAEMLAPGGNSLLAVVMKKNRRSLKNVQDCGFVPLERRPHWLAYDELSWNGTISEDKWDIVYATRATVMRCARLYLDHEFDRGLHLTQPDGTDPIDLRIELPGLILAEEDIYGLARGDLHVELTPPPDRLELADN